MDSKPLFKKFQTTLLQYSQTEDLDERRTIEEHVWSEYGAEYAVFVLDMSGFSLSVRRSGIVAHLCEIRRVQRLVLPLLEDHGTTGALK